MRIRNLLHLTVILIGLLVPGLVFSQDSLSDMTIVKRVMAVSQKRRVPV